MLSQMKHLTQLMLKNYIKTVKYFSTSAHFIPTGSERFRWGSARVVFSASQPAQPLLRGRTSGYLWPVWKHRCSPWTQNHPCELRLQSHEGKHSIKSHLCDLSLCDLEFLSFIPTIINEFSVNDVQFLRL